MKSKINPLTGGLCSIEQMMEWEYCRNCKIAGKCQRQIELEESEKNEIPLPKENAIPSNKWNNGKEEIKVSQP